MFDKENVTIEFKGLNRKASNALCTLAEALARTENAESFACSRELPRSVTVRVGQ